MAETPPPSPGGNPAVGPVGVGVAVAPVGADWRLVLPVKGGPSAKSRLGAARATTPGLPAALALDTLDAVLACGRTSAAWVVCADATLRSRLAGARVHLVAESAPGAGLLAAIADGLAALDRADELTLDAIGRSAGAGHVPPRGVAVLLADVPCLRAQDLEAALDQAEAAFARGARQAVVLDAEGTGTVLLAAPSTHDLSPRFGVGSAAAHRGQGAVVVGADLARLRRDVDTTLELGAARRLGLGRHTAAALDPLRSRAS